MYPVFRAVEGTSAFSAPFPSFWLTAPVLELHAQAGDDQVEIVDLTVRLCAGCPTKRGRYSRDAVHTAVEIDAKVAISQVPLGCGIIEVLHQTNAPHLR